MIEKKRIFFVLLLLLPLISLSSTWGLAQGGEGGGGGGGGGGSDSGGSSGGGSTGGQSSSSQADRQRPMFLTGTVLLDNGEAPGPRTKVELICQGSVVRQEYTSNSGTFSIEIAGGQQGTQPMDASVSSSGYSRLGSGGASVFGGSTGIAGGLASRRSVDLSSCELRAELPEYQSDVIALGRRRALDNPDVGLIILHSIKPPEIGTVSLKTLAAPKDARKAHEKAGKELQKETPNLSKATKELEKAVKIYPGFASAFT